MRFFDFDPVTIGQNKTEVIFRVEKVLPFLHYKNFFTDERNRILQFNDQYRDWRMVGAVEVVAFDHQIFVKIKV